MNRVADLKGAEQLLSVPLYQQQSMLVEGEIKQIVERFRTYLVDIYGLQDSDFPELIRILESKYVTTMGYGNSLVNLDIPHDENWHTSREITWSYWQDYEDYLLKRGLAPRVVSALNSGTGKVLGLLQDPHKEGDWERRGLVIGHVQSGKTANYIGLVAKAADAGYKFIIVIAGIHNNLRRQTQERVDEGFIGRDSITQMPSGVGLISPNRATPVTVTTAESDFNKSVAKRFGVKLDAFNNTFILVIKKNVSTLKYLYLWLKTLNTRGELGKITDIPMLMIDDEADSASINTNKPELDPTRTNKEIRNILNLFRKKCYVGYTATPFANIFINPQDATEMLGSDLFPEHFIHSLDAPTNYFGADKIFIDEESSAIFLRIIDDAEDYIPLKHKKSESITGLPPSLQQAIRIFLLSRAIRNLRGQQNSHASMLVNVSRFVATQREVRQLIKDYLEELQKAIKFNYRLDEESALRNRHMAQFHQDYLREYSGAETESWSQVMRELNNAVESAQDYVINSKSVDTLDYQAYARDGNAATVIAVGGLSLSRGLTLEGLTVSYMYRNSKMYDTLMQMGRWFGYRDGYEDLCRVYMSEESIGWYQHIAEATEELRMQITRMRQLGKKPSDFGLYVRAHPDTLIVTALNKMRYTDTRSFQVSYDGKMLETHIIPASDAKNEHNRKLLLAFDDQLYAMGALEPGKPYRFFKDIPWTMVQDLLLEFQFHSDLIHLNETVPAYVKEISDLYPHWDVAYTARQNRDPETGYKTSALDRTIGYDENNNVILVPRGGEPGWYTGKKQRLSDNKMASLGLTEAQLRAAKALADEFHKGRDPIYGDYTNARGKPLLMLHWINLQDKDKQPVLNYAPALSVVFPNSNSFRTVEYTVNQVWLNQFKGADDELAASEDDYDLDT